MAYAICRLNDYCIYAARPCKRRKTKHPENYIGCRKNYIGHRKNYIRHNSNYIRPFFRHLQPAVKQILTKNFGIMAIYC